MRPRATSSRTSSAVNCSRLATYSISGVIVPARAFTICVATGDGLREADFESTWREPKSKQDKRFGPAVIVSGQALLSIVPGARRAVARAGEGVFLGTNDSPAANQASARNRLSSESRELPRRRFAGDRRRLPGGPIGGTIGPMRRPACLSPALQETSEKNGNRRLLETSGR